MNDEVRDDKCDLMVLALHESEEVHDSAGIFRNILEYSGIFRDVKCDLMVLALHESEEVHHSAGISKLVVVPRNQLDKFVRQLNASLGIEDG